MNDHVDLGEFSYCLKEKIRRTREEVICGLCAIAAFWTSVDFLRIYNDMVESNDWQNRHY